MVQAARLQQAAAPRPLYYRGAPPMVASGSRSIVYLCAAMYMMGTPGTCARGKQQGSCAQAGLQEAAQRWGVHAPKTC